MAAAASRHSTDAESVEGESRRTGASHVEDVISKSSARRIKFLTPASRVSFNLRSMALVASTVQLIPSLGHSASRGSPIERRRTPTTPILAFVCFVPMQHE